ncbi:MAG TPA: hypothetical protein VJ813_15875 [Vicinamibacterales bacterium]|nr:hypothetical protein [Vicinamibacterales bacterium]
MERLLGEATERDVVVVRERGWRTHRNRTAASGADDGDRERDREVDPFHGSGLHDVPLSHS